MANVLSRSEAEALLSSLDTILPVANRQNEFTKESTHQSRSRAGEISLNDDLLAILRTHHQLFFEACEKALASIANVSLDVQFVEFQVGLTDASKNQDEAALLEMSHRSAALDSEIEIIIDRLLVTDLINRTLGGPDETQKLHDCPLTDIETRIFERIVGSIVDAYDQTWLNVAQSSNNQEQVMDAIDLADQRIKSCFQVQIGDQRGSLGIVASTESIGQRAQRCVQEYREIGKSTTAGTADIELQESVVTVELNSTRLSLDEIRRLEVGDVVLSDTPLECGLRVIRDGTPRFLATAGVLEGRKAIQIGEPLENECD